MYGSSLRKNCRELATFCESKRPNRISINWWSFEMTVDYFSYTVSIGIRFAIMPDR